MAFGEFSIYNISLLTMNKYIVTLDNLQLYQ